jgi:hypothetical protein
VANTKTSEVVVVGDKIDRLEVLVLLGLEETEEFVLLKTD